MMRLLWLLSAPLLLGCGRDRDIREYYYPVRELTDGLVYQYENTGTLSEAESEYWYYLGTDLDTALYLTATRYDDGVTPVQVSTERISNEGASLQSLTLFPQLPTGERARAEAAILYGRTYPFYPEDGLASGYRVRFADPGNPGAENYVSLNRYFRSDTTLSVLGEQYDAVVFDLAGEVSQRDPELGDISPTFTGYEIYAEGIGLVEYRRDLGRGGVDGGKLIARLSMEKYTGSLQR